jgi:hypothetical protein
MNTRSLNVLGALIVSASCPSAALALNPTIPIRLLPGSSFKSENCLGPCACPFHIFDTPMTGWLTYRLVTIGDVTDFYEITGVHVYSEQPNRTFELTGSGTYRRAEPINAHWITLDIPLPDGTVLHFDSDFQPITAPLPRLDIIATSPQHECSRYTLNIVGGPRCHADVDDGSETGSPDGGVTLDDVLYYLGLFEAGDSAADLDDGSDAGIQDSGVTIDDLIYFLRHFHAGC